MPSGPAPGHRRSAPQPGEDAVSRADAELKLGAADLDAEVHDQQRNRRVQVVHHPVKRRQVDRLDDAHVVERHVQPVLRQRPQLAAAEAGAAERRQAVAVGPLDRPQDVRAVARAADGDEQVAGAAPGS